MEDEQNSIMAVFVGGLFVILIIFMVAMIISEPRKTEKKPYEQIKMEDKGAYVVKNVVYTGASLEIADLEKTMKQIKDECKKPCKINLFADVQAYNTQNDLWALDLDAPGAIEKRAEYITYLRKHYLAFLGTGEDEEIEYYGYLNY